MYYLYRGTGMSVTMLILGCGTQVAKLYAYLPSAL
jgi:hypothetical protein